MQLLEARLREIIQQRHDWTLPEKLDLLKIADALGAVVSGNKNAERYAVMVARRIKDAEMERKDG